MKELRYSWFCCRCVGRARVGKVIRTSVIVSNILYWFAGCAILSVAIWLRFVDVGTKNFFSTFHPIDTALYIVLVSSIVFLISSFVGTCAANTKNEIMISLYLSVVLLVSIAEIISLTVYSSSHYEIERDFSNWYKGHFEKYESKDVIHRDVVNHVQSKMSCCGMSGPRDYLVVFGNDSIPNSCINQIKLAENIFRPDVYTTGCKEKMADLIMWLLKGWPLPFVATVILLLQAAGISTSALYLQHIIYRKKFNYDDDESESSVLIESTKDATYSSSHPTQRLGNISLEDLPRPKLFRVVKSPIEQSFGFDVGYNEDRNCYVITTLRPESNAEYAGLAIGSQVIEINGMVLQGADQDEVYDKMESLSKELLMVVVDEKTEDVYRSNKVAVNLKNLEGVTDENTDYRPRSCNLKKGSQGFGFHLLYLEDRKGEYIEEVAVDSPAYEAGLSIGDRLIEVNGVNVETEKSRDVVKRIRMSGDVVNLLVVDPKSDGYYRKKGVSLTASLALDYFIGRASAPTASSGTSKRKSAKEVKPRYCRLVKSEKEDFGLYVVIDNSRIGQVIRWVDCGGPADRAGLRIGDRIIEVNGHSVEYESHQKLITCISLNKTTSHFIVVDEDYDHVYKRNKPRLCRIFKENGSFGFCVRHVPQKNGHYVEKVDNEGPAEAAGLMVDDRIIQVDGQNVEKESEQDVLNRLRACESEVVLLVIDSRANKHYKRIVQFKSEGSGDIDYNTVSIPEEPFFLVDNDDLSVHSDQISLSGNDHISTKGSQSRTSASITLLGENSSIDTERQCHRDCVVRMSSQEKQGFSLEIDRDRNGVIITNIKRGGPGERAGLHEGDRIISVNGQRINNLDNDEVMEKMKQGGRRFCLTVIDEESDTATIKHRPYVFRMTKSEGGYGFYLWNDDSGHYVEEVTIGSPADQSGMRSGDRIIEVNGVNVEEETHEEVFYRVKASMNVVSLLAVDQKTFRLYKKKRIPLSVLKAETNFSSDSASPEGTLKSTVEKTRTVTQELELCRESGGDFGFNLAYSNSFIGDTNTGSHVVHWVELGGPAYIAGLRDGDKIVAVEGIDVRQEDQDQVIQRIYQVGKRDVVLTIEYEEEQDAYVPHTIKIGKIENTFGFHLWFDQNGHFIEDVTIGSSADAAGLKIGDRVLKVNEIDVGEATHADVVAIVRQSGEEVSMLVLNVQSENIGDFSTPTVFTMVKEKGTFGFTLSQDDKGFHFDYVEPYSPSDKLGISVGDRLLEISGEPVSTMTYNQVVSAVKHSGMTVTLTVISSNKFASGSRNNEASDSSSNQIFNELRGKDKIDYVVEKKGFALYGRDDGITDNYVTRNGQMGKDNPGYVEDGNDSHIATIDELMTDDIKGRFLDDKLLPQASSHATMRRRRPGKNIYNRNRQFAAPKPTTERRRRNLMDIEQRLGSTNKRARPRSLGEKVTYMKESINRSKSQKEKHFKLVTSKSSIQQKWSFEQSDSRRPGEIKNVLVGDSIPEEEEDDSVFTTPSQTHPNEITVEVEKDTTEMMDSDTEQAVCSPDSTMEEERCSPETPACPDKLDEEEDVQSADNAVQNSGIRETTGDESGDKCSKSSTHQTSNHEICKDETSETDEIPEHDKEQAGQKDNKEIIV